MCFILIGLKAHPNYPFILAANRDEFYARPTRAAEFWQENPNILAGRDLQAGGTWLGVNRSGRICALTNFRNPSSHDSRRKSRGDIVTNWLDGTNSIYTYLNTLKSKKSLYNGYSLLAGNLKQLYFFSNYSVVDPSLLTKGIYALSNHLLDTPWPKVINGKKRFAGILKSRDGKLTDSLLELLSDRTKSPDTELPETGVAIDMERSLSPIFIDTPEYGTRCSTVIVVDQNGKVEFTERTFTGKTVSTVALSFSITDV